MDSDLLSESRKPPCNSAPLPVYQLCSYQLFSPRTIDDRRDSTRDLKLHSVRKGEKTMASCKRKPARDENEGVCAVCEGRVSCCALGPGRGVTSRRSCLVWRPGSLSCTQVGAPQGHISVWYSVADTTHVCARAGLAEDEGARLSLCLSRSVQRGCPWCPQDYWANDTAEMKTSAHDLHCLKQTSKQTIQPLVTLESGAQPWTLGPSLTRVNVAGSDLLLVFAAGELGAFEPLLYSHVAFLNPASAQFGAFRPGCPRAHPTA